MIKSEIDTEAEARDLQCRVDSSMQSSKNHKKYENYKKYYNVTWFSDNHKQTTSFQFQIKTRNNT